MKNRSFFNNARISVLLAIVLSLLLTQVNFVSAVQDDTPKPVRLHSRYADTSAEGYLTEKVSLLRSGTDGLNLSVALDPVFASGEADDFLVHIFLPTFELNAEGIAEQVEPSQDPTGMGIKATTNLGDGWYNVNSNVAQGGWITVGYNGKVLGGDNPGFNLNLETFTTSNDPKYASIPEGTTARIHGYVEYTRFNDIENNGWETPDKFDEFSVVEAVVSNLDWETKITLAEKGNDQIVYPWDRYNYGDFHVTLNNNSTNVGSIIQGYRIGIEMDSTLINGQGVLPSDINKWIYQEGQDPELNTNPDYNVEGLFIGVEGQGGVLIYDITDLKENEDLGAPLPYFYTSGGGIMLGSIDDDLSKNEWIYSPRSGESTTAKKFLVRVPYAPQGFPNLGDSNVRTSTQITTNIRFAQKSNWTKSDSVLREIAKPFADMSIKKTPEKTPVLFGDETYFLINGITNTGKQTIYNPYIIDKLPNNGFLFDRIEIEIKDGLGLKDITKDATFAQYLSDGEWVSFDESLIREIESRNGNRVYSIDAKFLQVDSNFEKQVRINTNVTLTTGESLPAEFKVYGKVTSTVDVTNHVEGYFQSKVNSNNIKDDNGNLLPEGDLLYKFSDHGPVKDSAFFKPLLPSKVNPKVSVMVGNKSSLSTSLTVDQDEEGYLVYRMGNKSSSRSPKGSVMADLGRSLDTKFFGRGFNPTQITVNSVLFDSADVKTVTLIDINEKAKNSEMIFEYIDGVLVSGDITIEANESGDFVIEDTVYEEMTLSKVIVEFKEFSTIADTIDWLRVDGIYNHEKGQTALFKSELVLEQQRPHTDTRTITAQASVLVRLPVAVNPSVDVRARFNTTLHTSSVEVPYEREAEFDYYFGNNSVSAAPSALFEVDLGSNGNHEANIVQTLTLYNDFLESGQLESIELFNSSKTKSAEFKLDKDGSYVYKDIVLKRNESGDIEISKDMIESMSFTVRHITLKTIDFKTSALNILSMNVTGIAQAPMSTGTATSQLSHVRSTARAEMTQQHPITGVRTASDNASWTIANNTTTVALKGTRRLQNKGAAWDDRAVPYSYLISSYPNRYATDNMLDMGYKALGSFTNSFTRSSGPTFNTQSTLVSTTTFPVDQFDAYYMMLDAKTKSFIDTVEIYRNVDGKEVLWQTIYGDAHGDGSLSQWVTNSNTLDGKPDGTHFRINLALASNDGDSLFSTHDVVEGENHPYYKHAFDKDNTENLVSKVVVTYQFNQEQSGSRNDLQGTTTDAIEFTGRFHKVTTNADTAGVTSGVSETHGAMKPITKNHSSTSVVINTGNTRAAGATGVNGAIANKTQSIEIGQRGEYLVSVENYGSRLTEKSTSGYDDWSTTGLTSFIPFQEELFVNFALPTHQGKDKESYFDAQDFTIEETIKKYLTKVRITHTDGVIEIDKNDLEEGTNKFKFVYGDDNSSDFLIENNEVVIPKGHYPTHVELVLEEIPGFGESSSEIDGVTGDIIGSLNTIQMRIGGIVNGNKALTGSTYIQRMNSAGTARQSISTSSATITGRTSSLRYGITYTSDNEKTLFYDFKADGITPNTTTLRLNLANTGEANINEMKLTVTPDVNFRTRRIQIPATLVDGEKWSVHSIVIDGKQIPIDMFILNGDFYELDINDLFEDLLKVKKVAPSFEFNEERIVKDIRSIVVEYVAKGDHFASGSDHSDDLELKQLDAKFDDFILIGDFVDESTDEWSSRATQVGTSQFTITNKASAIVKSPNQFTTSQNSGTYNNSMTFINRRTVMTTDMKFEEDGHFVKNGKLIPQNQLMVGDRTTAQFSMTNTGELATGDHESGHLLLQNPVGQVALPKGIRLRSWKLVTTEDNLLKKDVQEEILQANVSFVSGKLEVPANTVLNESQYKDLKNFRFDFTDTVIDYGKSVILELEFEAYNDFDKNNIFASQGKTTGFNVYARPAFLHDFESYTTNVGSSTTYVSNQRVYQTFGGPNVIYGNARNTSSFAYINPGNSNSTSSATAAKIKYDFLEENVSTEDLNITVSNIKNYSGHDDTNYTLTLVLNSLDSKDNHLNGFVLEQMPQAQYPEGFNGSFESVKLYYKDKSADWIEYVGQNLDTTEINELKFDYGILPAFDAEGDIFSLPNIIVEGTGHWRQESTVFNNIHTIKGNTVSLYEHYFEDELAAALQSVHNDQTRVLKAMPFVSLDFQAFENQDNALEPYTSNNSNIKTSYRPNEVFWYKGTLINTTIEKNVQGSNPYGTGTFENPVFIDRIPEYITPKFMDFANEVDGVYTIDVKAAIEAGAIDLKWFESEGYTNLNYSEKDPSTYHLPSMTAKVVKGADIGGDQVFKGVGKNAGTGYLSNQQPINTSTNPASIIEYLELIIDFGNTEDVVLDRGEKIELAYSVQVRENNLPRATYGDNDRAVYAPFMGSYGTTGRHTSVVNEVMDMDSLLHDFGVSGKRSFEQSTLQFLTKGNAYISGMDESNGIYYDGSARTNARHNTEIRDQYNDQYSIARNAISDTWALQLKGRVDGVQSPTSERILWAQSNIHLTKAWLYGASEMTPKVKKTNGVSNPGNFYEDDGNLSNTLTNNSSSYQIYEMYDGHTYAVEYLETFDVTLRAQNYGDYGLNGIQFIEILPHGVSPVFNVDGSIDVSATLGGVDIDETKVSVEIIQTPESVGENLFKAPKSNLEGRNAYNSDSLYGDDVVPYVIKISVNERLGEWFNRKNANNLDYKMEVKFEVYVTHENLETIDGEGSMWFDQVLVSPLDVKDSDSQYYEVYSSLYGGYTEADNRTQLRNDAVPLAENMASFGYYGNRKFEPYTPYIRGLNAQAREINSEELNILHTTDFFDVDEGSVRYASGGDQLKMRNPMMRSFSILDKGENSDWSYDLYERFTLNVNVENIQIYDHSTHYARNSTTPRTHAPQTNGGARGSWFSPIVTVLVPEGVTPMDIRGNEFTPETVAELELDYSIKHNRLTATTSSQIGDVKDFFDVVVTYETFDDKTKAGQYVITFTLKEEFHDTFKVQYNQGLVFSPELKVTDLPNAFDDNGKEHVELYSKMQEIFVFASSSRDIFNPVVETSYASGTYSGSSSASAAGNSIYTHELKRRDAVIPSKSAQINLHTADNPFVHSRHYNEKNPIDVSHNVSKLGNKFLTESFMNMLNGIEGNTYESLGASLDSKGVYATTKIATRRPNVITTIDMYNDLSNLNVSGKSQIEVGTADKFYYSLLVENRAVSVTADTPRLTDHETNGHVHHAQLVFNVWLPEIVSFNDNFGIYTEGNLLTKENLIDFGYKVEVTKDNTQKRDDKKGGQLVQFKITLPHMEEDPTTYGVLRTGGSFKFIIESRVTSAYGEIGDPLIPWNGADLQAKIYTNFEETDGSFNETAGINKRVKQHPNSMKFSPRFVETSGVDVNDNGLEDEQFTVNTTSIKVTKPNGFIRKNMVRPRDLFSNGSIGDPYFTGADTIQYIMSQVNNLGSAVPELVIEDILPHYEEQSFFGNLFGRSASSDSTSNHPISTIVHSVQTGNWELPQSFINQYPDLDLNEKYRVYVSISYGYGEWIELNPEGSALNDNQLLELDRNQKEAQIKGVRWNVRSDDKENFLIPTGFRAAIDADPNKVGTQEVSETDPNNDSIHYYPESVTANAPLVNMEASTHKALTTYIFNKANLIHEYTLGNDYESSTSMTRGYLTPSRPIVDIKYDVHYFKNQGIDGAREYVWSTDLSINPRISPHMRYSAQIINADQTMWTEEESARYTENIYDNPEVVFELPQNFIIDPSDFKHVDDSLITEDHPLHLDYEKNASLNDASQSNIWTWRIVTKDGEPSYSNLKLVDEVYVGSWPKVKQSIVRMKFEGRLYPGDSLVVDYIGKVNDTSFDNTSVFSRVNVYNDTGMMNPLNSILVDGDRKLGFDIDPFDMNNDSRTNDRVVSAESQRSQFASYNDFPKKNLSYSELGNAGSSDNIATPVPESKSYMFETNMSNPNSTPYAGPIMFDILPHIGDKMSNGAERKSKWSGILDIDSFQMIVETTDKTQILKENEYDIFIGPFRKVGNAGIELVSMDEVPGYDVLTTHDYFKSIRNDDSILAAYTVSLEDLQKFKKANPNEYSKLIKEARVITARFSNKNRMLEASSKMRLTYEMRAPLNLPFFTGDVEYKDAQEYMSILEDYLAWNTFLGWQDSAGYNPQQSNQAGVYINAPKNRAYIGDYIWLDVNQDGKQNEAKYSKSLNGRMLPSEFIDILGNGEKTDPGINGVLIELLTEDGYPSDIDGNPVMSYQKDGQTIYVKADVKTGMPELDETFGEVILTGKPYSFETESDVYGNQGYFILSNLKPQNYRLKYTFPDEFNHFSITSGKLHNNVGFKQYHRGDVLPELYAGQDEKDLTVQSMTLVTDTFNLKANQDDSYYTNFTLGVYETIQIGGTIFKEIGEVSGIYDPKTDALLEGYKVTLHEEDGTIAKDTLGNDLVTYSDAKGKYVFTYVPIGHTYYATVMDENGEYSDSTPISPIRNNADPLSESEDNDFYKMQTDHGFVYRTPSFTTSKPSDDLRNADNSFEDTMMINAGFIDRTTKASIGNYIWNDLNRDGIQDENEPGISGVKLILEQYTQVKDVVSEDEIMTLSLFEEPKEIEWELNDSFSMETTTNDDGLYHFGNLPAFEVVDGVEYELGYRVRVEVLPFMFTPTMRLVEEDLNKVSQLSTDGYIGDIVTLIHEKDRNLADSYMSANGGLVTYDSGVISGVVSEKHDQVNLQSNELTYLGGYELSLEFFNEENQEWQAVYRDHNQNTYYGNVPFGAEPYRVVTDALGHYKFTNLMMVDPLESLFGNTMPYEYRVVGLPLDITQEVIHVVDGEAITFFKQNDDRTVNSITAKIISEENILSQDFYKATDVTEFNLELIRYVNKSTISSRVYSDKNSNGQDDNEKGVEGVEVYLLMSEDEDWNNIADLNGNSKVITDENGYYSFDVQAVDLNSKSFNYLNPNQFRLVFKLVEGASWVNDDLITIAYGDESYAISEIFTLADEFEDEENDIDEDEIDNSDGNDQEVDDTDVEDTEVEDTDVEDTEVEDTEVEDTEVEDTEVEDTDEDIDNLPTIKLGRANLASIRDDYSLSLAMHFVKPVTPEVIPPKEEEVDKGVDDDLSGTDKENNSSSEDQVVHPDEDVSVDKKDESDLPGTGVGSSYTIYWASLFISLGAILLMIIRKINNKRK